MKEKILVIGACGQSGVELTAALRTKFGKENVVAIDVKDEHPLLSGTGPFVNLDAMDKSAIASLIKKESIGEVYHLAALLSGTGEKNPQLCWELNM